jgi:1,4-dihydroxy-2-naphthoate octaprenyltransferase
MLSVVLLYLLGIGMARYSGAIIDWEMVWLGLLWLLALQLSGSFLHANFADSVERTHNDDKNASVILSHSTCLLLAYACLAVVASISVLVIYLVDNPTIFLLMAAMVSGAIVYSLPPIRLEYTGYGELVVSVLIANFTPALGYFLQGGDSLRFLTMVTFPLTILHLAMLLAFSLSTYAIDMKYERRTLMLRLGWQNGVLLHNILILCAYLLLMLAITFGLSWQTIMPAILTLPFGLFQIWMVNRIAGGGKPNWKALQVLASALFGVTVYLLAFGFWIR